MKLFLSIFTLLFFISAKGQKQFDSLQVEKALLSLPGQTTQTHANPDIIQAIEAIDKKYRQVADTLYSYKSLKYTLFQTFFIETNDSVFINPLTFGDKIHTSSIVFYAPYLNTKVDSIARRLSKKEAGRLYSYLRSHFDNFSEKEKKFSPQPVRIRYIKFPDARMVQAGIDIYGQHFLWTIDKKQNWDVIKVESLWMY